MDGAIQTTGLTKVYGRQVGIQDLDLDVHRGEVFGFLGPNGAGKTTTIRLLLGLIRPTRGSATVLGYDLTQAGPAIRAGIGYIPGNLALYERMTGKELLRFLGRMRGGVAPGAYETLADRLSLDLSRRIHDLSKGNRQKLGVVQAFMHAPELLILDEPTSSLDPLVQLEFHDLVRETVDRGATVFLSSHVLSEVEHMADRVGIVADGRLVVVDTVDGLRTQARRRIELDFPGNPPTGLDLLAGVRAVEVRGSTAICWVTGPLTPLLTTAVQHGVVDIHTHDPDLEDAFLGYVERGVPAQERRSGVRATSGQ